MSGLVISTDKAQCRDCYRCVRTCHVKALRVQGGQAEVVEERCVVCGRCVRACPQHAKHIRNDLEAVKALIASGAPVVASVAPSVPAFLDVHSFAQVRAMLARLGFADASETALGAEIVGEEYSRLLRDETFDRTLAFPLIATACPVVVSMVEKYHPDLVPNLAPIVSPMVAHGRWLKRTRGQDTRVVFIGPCAAKKSEAADPVVSDAVDAALTFQELLGWLDEEAIAPSPLLAPELPDGRPARLFPVGGGLLRTARLDTDLLAVDTVVATGIENCEEALDAIRLGTLQARLVELLACPEGCISGPGAPEDDNVFLKRQKILRFARQREDTTISADGIRLDRGYSDQSIHQPDVPEGVILDLLARIEKFAPEDELNCSACGYNSCREKAEATYRGLAEIGMCVPYMRRRAESLANLVMEVVPTAIVVLDYDLVVQEASPSAEALLGCRRQQAVGQSLAEFLPIGTFEEVRAGLLPVLGRRTRYRDGLIVKEFVVPVPRSKLIVGIVEDVTREERQQAELLRIREATIEQAQEVIDKQISVAHEIASLLGETTAETKVQLSRMIEVIRGRETDESREGRSIAGERRERLSDGRGGRT